MSCHELTGRGEQGCRTLDGKGKRYNSCVAEGRGGSFIETYRVARQGEEPPWEQR